jgi:RimJ/RimL family protein N-acetyltransferase
VELFIEKGDLSMLATPLPPQLPADVLARCESLPLKPAPVTLAGQYVRLEPLVVARDAPSLFEVSNGNPITLGERSVDAYDADSLIWRYMFDGPFENIEDFRAGLPTHVDAANGLCLCVFDLASGRQVGVTNFMNNSPAHLKIELGGIWYSPVVQRTQANTEATYLMLTHAFDLGYRRLEWKCHAHNERSRRAALRMGFKFEGIQESHMIVKGRNRDTAWFRLLEAEWPEVKEKLEALLYNR